MLKKCLPILIGVIFGLSLANIAVAQQTMNTASSNTPTIQQSQPTPAQPMLVPSPPNINASAYVLMDADSGKIIAQKNMDQRIAPASLTKLMTLYLTSQALASNSIQLTSQAPISKKAWKTGGSKMFVKVGDNVPVQDLMQGIIVDSGNDACVAMSEFIAGSEEAFVNMMNAEAQRLGMKNTHYIDCTGLPHQNHYSSAHDLAILARAIVKDYPQYYQFYKQKWFTYNGIRQPNRNRLLWRYPYADGLKTGHTEQAGYCLIASALKDGTRLIAVVMGTPTDEARANDTMALLTYGFRFYETHEIYQGGSVIATPRVWFGADKTVPVGLVNDLYITIPHSQFQSIKINAQIQPNLQAPIQKGQTVGTLDVTLNNEIIATENLVALQADTKGGVLRRSMDHISHLFHSWFKSKPVVQSASVSPASKAATKATAQEPTTAPQQGQALQTNQPQQNAPQQTTQNNNQPATQNAEQNTQTQTPI